MSRVVIAGIAILLVAPVANAADVEVTGIQVMHRDGQTFITWKDAAEGEAGAAFRYSLYRSEQPITQENLAKAELCYHGVLNNSARLYGHAYHQKDRQDPNLPTVIIEAGGKPLPQWSGVAVHTARKDSQSYYAIVTTDEKYQPLSKVVPGRNATTQPVAEKVAAIQPIKQLDSKERKGPYVANTSISGQKGLPLS